MNLLDSEITITSTGSDGSSEVTCCTFREFLADNEVHALEAIDIYCELSAGREYTGGGGAAPGWVLRVAPTDPLPPADCLACGTSTPFSRSEAPICPACRAKQNAFAGIM